MIGLVLVVPWLLFLPVALVLAVLTLTLRIVLVLVRAIADVWLGTLKSD